MMWALTTTQSLRSKKTLRYHWTSIFGQFHSWFSNDHEFRPHLCESCALWWWQNTAVSFFFNFLFSRCSTLINFDGSMELGNSIPTFVSFHLNAASPSLMARKSVSPQLKVCSLLNEEPWTSSFAFFCFLSFGNYFFHFHVAVFGFD